MNTKIKVIGIGDDGEDSLLPLYQSWIKNSERLVGGERQLSFFPHYEGEKITIQGGLSTLLTKLKEEPKDTIVLASGDPLFYGIGRYLSTKLEIETYPNISSIQLAFARLNESWNDAYVISLHGRKIQGFAQKIHGKKKVAILTDKTNTPATIAQYLLSFNMHEYTAFVAENLGGETEHYQSLTLEEMATRDFSPLNVVILQQMKEVKQWTIGIDDEEFYQRKPEKGLLTKKEIRTLSLSELKLHEKSVVWDIGTCTGSVAIEACLVAKEGHVFAIEKNTYDIENCRQNMKKFRTDFTVVQGKAPEGLDEFLDPDSIFIGGTAGSMADIITLCCTRLKPNGRIVLNAVTIENLSQALELFKSNNFETKITLAQVSRSKPILNLTRFDALNPIYIITAKHIKENES
ncbi:precorrin-6y C5,15-methyltransferase (decarboxylating) subunit CbiE [Metabacillus sp. HB246100]